MGHASILLLYLCLGLAEVEVEAGVELEAQEEAERLEEWDEPLNWQLASRVASFASWKAKGESNFSLLSAGNLCIHLS